MNTASQTRSTRSIRNLGRKTVINLLVGAFVLLGLGAGVFVGTLINRDPASAQEVPAPTCVLFCDTDGTGSGEIGNSILPELANGGSGTIGATPSPVG
jgi:hypothetical protein